MISAAVWLLALQGVLGAFDTLYYHEWRARLPARGAAAAPELGLHAAGRPVWVAWQGLTAAALVGTLAAEIVLTND